MKRIKTSLENLFNEDRRWSHNGRRIVFWYDDDGQFQETFNELELENIKKLQLNDNPFSIKYQLLHLYPNDNFLIYAPYAEPPYEENGLLDIQLYSLPFRADPAALIYADLGLSKRHLENIIRQYISFFNQKKYREDIIKMSLASETDEKGLYIAMLSVLVGLKVPDANLLIRQVLMAGLLESDNQLWQEIDKFDLISAFWEIVKDQTHFKDNRPSLNKLFKSLLITHFQKTLQGEFPQPLIPYTLTSGDRAYAFINQWMRDKEDSEVWKSLSQLVAEEINLDTILPTLTPKTLYESDTFERIDQHLLRCCIKDIQQQQDLTPWLDGLQLRKSRFWYDSYQAHYQAVEAAITLFSLKNQYPHGFKGTAQDLFTAYAQQLYQFDQAYRHFLVASDKAKGDILKPLVTTIDNLYIQWYLEELGQSWSDSMGNHWEIDNIPCQTRFYRQNIEPILKKNDREKTFVIISDALRYEVAEELKTRIQKELRGEITLKPYLGVLPSETSVGMAALLPGNRLTLKPNTSDTLRDDLSTQGSLARELVLNQNSQVSAKVLQADELLAMNTEQGRQTIQPYRLLYIYHDQIDKISHKAENQVFQACEETINQILRLVKKICNALNGTHVMITADHGFLYQHRPITEAEKRPVLQQEGILETKRRYIIGNNLYADEGTQTFTLPYDSYTVLVPRGSLRFARQGGGSQYVHGGASLQEICVPAIAYRHKRSTQSDEALARKVGVQVNVRVRRITNNRFTLNLVQTDPVEGRWRSRRIAIAFYDPNNDTPLTDVQTVMLSNPSPNLAERTVTVRLTITHSSPPSQGNLIIKDADDETELIRESWSINLGIANDFGDF